VRAAADVGWMEWLFTNGQLGRRAEAGSSKRLGWWLDRCAGIAVSRHEAALLELGTNKAVPTGG